MTKRPEKRAPLKLTEVDNKVISASLATMKAEGPPVPALGGLESFAKPILALVGRGWSNAIIAHRLTKDLHAAGSEVKIGAHHIQRLIRKLKDATSQSVSDAGERAPSSIKRNRNAGSATINDPATGAPEGASEPAFDNAPAMPPQAAAPSAARRQQFV